jgi:hypothetical protein
MSNLTLVFAALVVFAFLIRLGNVVQIVTTDRSDPLISKCTDSFVQKLMVIFGAGFLGTALIDAFTVIH